MKVIPLQNSKNIQIKLKGNVYTADLSKELAIDVSQLREELMAQPSKYAWWSVLVDITQSKVNRLEQQLQFVSPGSDRHDDLVQEYTKLGTSLILLCETKQALKYRRDTILKLMHEPHKVKHVASAYKQQVSSLKALSA